jgi:phage shock protein PspC (stress-responsive transcriptional regulator)
MNDNPSTSSESSGPALDAAHRPGAPAGRLCRRRDDRMLAGVAAGLADWFDVDPTLVRLGFVVLAALGGVAVPIYLAAWLLLPEEGVDRSVAEELLARQRAH